MPTNTNGSERYASRLRKDSTGSICACDLASYRTPQSSIAK
jgi:hypothetical protein